MSIFSPTDPQSVSNEYPDYSAISSAIDVLDRKLEEERASLATVGTPIALMRARAESAEAALKASDTALAALRSLQQNSLESIQSINTVIASIKSTLKEDDQVSGMTQYSLEELGKIIEKNKDSLHASALALSALTELAFNDPLTGLPNRRLLKDRLTQIIISNKRWNSFGAAIFLDLDKFKRLNDEFGHEVGDELLIAVGNRLKSCVRESDTVSRYGGDEFVILLSRLNGNLPDARSEAEDIANKILDSLNPLYTLHSRNSDGVVQKIEYRCFASIGVVMFSGDVNDESIILDWADEAMYWAKNEGGHTVRFYDAMTLTRQTLMRLYQLATENDIETSNHGIRTRQYVKTLAHRAELMNMYPDQLDSRVIERLFNTTQLHDIGKTMIPYSMIHQQGKLSEDEWVEMKTHTLLGGKILKEAKSQNSSLADFLDTAIEIAESHHERWDGKGYPRGLIGNAIPLAGRIMGIADVYDALISKRSYKEPWTHHDACVEIISGSGTLFDPLLIEAFKREQDTFRQISEAAQD